MTEESNTSRNPLGLIVLMAGAAAITIPAFRVGVWEFLLPALVIAYTGYEAYRKPAEWARPLGFSAIATVVVSNLLFLKVLVVSLDPVGALPGATDPALYFAAVGCVLALVGSLMLRQSAGSGHGGPGGQMLPVRAHTYKKCPDCAATIPAEAAVCKHCSHQFPNG